MPETSKPQEGADDQAGEKTVPLSALVEQRQAAAELRQQVAELRGRLDGMAKPSEPKKTYTATELQARVDKGELTKAEANQILQRQNDDRIQQLVSESVTKAISGTKRTETVQSSLARYYSAIPALNDTSSQERQKAEREFARLTSDLEYDAKDPRTQLVAMQMAFGPIEALEASKETGGRGESHQETGSSGGSNGSSSWPKDMPAKNRTYYERQIAKGVYTKESALAEWRA